MSIHSHSLPQPTSVQKVLVPCQMATGAIRTLLQVSLYEEIDGTARLVPGSLYYEDTSGITYDAASVIQVWEEFGGQNLANYQIWQNNGTLIYSTWSAGIDVLSFYNLDGTPYTGAILGFSPYGQPATPKQVAYKSYTVVIVGGGIWDINQWAIGLPSTEVISGVSIAGRIPLGGSTATIIDNSGAPIIKRRNFVYEINGHNDYDRIAGALLVQASGEAEVTITIRVRMDFVPASTSTDDGGSSKL